MESGVEVEMKHLFEDEPVKQLSRSKTSRSNNLLVRRRNRPRNGEVRLRPNGVDSVRDFETCCWREPSQNRSDTIRTESFE